jgi:diaminopropionate ammonia-lyase
MPTSFVPIDPRRPENLFGDHDFAAQHAFFTERPTLAPTPLHTHGALARRLDIGRLVTKDETCRFGSNAFKAVGVAFATARLLARGDIAPGDTLACASEGNHGRAVARAARELGCRARVYMSHRVAQPRVDAIRSEGADVVIVDGSYDDAVRAVATDATTNGWAVISDTSWPGYTEIPRLIMLGYTRVMDEDWGTGRTAARRPDVVFVPGGVGGLLAAVACWSEWRYGRGRPRIVAVEPVSAACLQTSARHGRPTTVAGPFDTEMGGLRCGEMSPMVFPAIATLVDAFVAIEDAFAFEAMRLLAAPPGGDAPVQCGPSGAAALGGLLAVLNDSELIDVRDRLGLNADAGVEVLVTEGVTDAKLYEKVVART